MGTEPRPCTRAPTLARTLLAALPLLVLAAPGGEAQPGSRLQGVVRDAATAQPLFAVELRLLGAEPAEIVVASDAAGRFTLPVPRSGRYVVAARRIGYDPATSGEVEIAAGATATLEIVMLPTPLLLDTIATEASENERHVLLGGFERRRRLGGGVFFTREDIAARGPRTAYDLVRNVVGARLTTNPFRGVAGDGRPVAVRRCSSVVFVDGVRASSSDEPPDRLRLLFEGLPGAHLEAVEVYHGQSQLPGEFAHPDVRCGAIVVWTRKPGPDRSAPPPAP